MSPQQIIAHYRITAKLGEGGMGEVYRATDTKLGRDVAIKIIPDSFAQDADRMARFKRESQVLASLNHPNIAAIYGVEDNAIVMELVEGEELRGPIPLHEALPIIHQLIDALEYAHDKGVVHRDLKPANIKLTPDARVKVLDFGLAKALATDAAAASNPASSPTLTMRASEAGMIMGTAAYMAPEQARGQNVDRRADIWAFGVAVWEMLTGRRLFEGATVSDTLAAVLTKQPDLDAVPVKMRRLLRVCLVKDPRQRLGHISGARFLLDDAQAEDPRYRSNAFPWVISALLALVAVALALVHFREKPPEPATVRFEIPAPEKTGFADSGFALSPDGRKLAFIATSANGRFMLWVRSLDSVTAQALPGTEDVRFLPFWSPDSRFIGFLVQGKLKKVDASGGPVQTLCELRGVLVGGAWSSDGTILFGTSTSGLFKVPQAGGVATPLTTPDSSKGEAGHIRPWFLPDGRHFVYFGRGDSRADDAIYLASLNGKERKRLMAAAQAAAYAPPATSSENGHLLFLREGTLMAQPFDAKRFELAGEPFPVAEQVGSRLALGFFSVSANGVLAYRSGATRSLQLAWFDRTGKPQGVLGPGTTWNFGVALSPDGKRAAVSQQDQAGHHDIWMLDVMRGIPTRFTFDPASATNPVWSPDGKWILFASNHISSADIYRKESSGSANEELVLKSGAINSPWDWSQDGTYLLYGVQDPKTAWDLWVLPDPGGTPGNRKPTPYLQTPFNEIQGQFSPGPAGAPRWIAYASDESGQYQIYVQSFPAGAGKFQVSGVGGTQPRWRRDGKELFYIARDGKLMAADVKTAPTFEAGPPRALFDAGPLGYDVTADGKRFLMTTFGGTSEGSASAPITVVLNWTAGLKH